MDIRQVLIHGIGEEHKLSRDLESVGYNRRMPEPNKLAPNPGPPTPGEPPAPTQRTKSCDDDKVLCERCGAEMFRMHAVWRCPACRYKTDCCGW
jgi:hypothetical protein